MESAAAAGANASGNAFAARPRRPLPASSQHAQFARRLEVDAMEAKRRFTRDLLMKQQTILAHHKQQLSSHDIKIGVNDNPMLLGEGDKSDGSPELMPVQSSTRLKKKKRKKERSMKPRRKVPLTVDTSKARSSVEVLRHSLNELGWHWKEVGLIFIGQDRPLSCR